MGKKRKIEERRKEGRTSFLFFVLNLNPSYKDRIIFIKNIIKIKFLYSCLNFFSVFQLLYFILFPQLSPIPRHSLSIKYKLQFPHPSPKVETWLWRLNLATTRPDYEQSIPNRPL